MTWLDLVKEAGGMLRIASAASLIALPFTLYFFSTKIGHKIAANHSWTAGPFIASGIRSVTLMNLKDRPVPIFEIHAVMGNLSFHLKKFDPPLILKAMEAANIDVDIASERFLGHESYDWKPVPGKADSVDIYVSTVAKSIKCSRRYPYDRTAFSIKKKLRPVMHLTHRFNEVIYNDNARYAITYCDEKAKKTALISTGGTIYWDYPISALRPSEMKSCATVRAAIVATGLEPMIAPFFVDDLHKDRGEGRAAVVT